MFRISSESGPLNVDYQGIIDDHKDVTSRLVVISFVDNADDLFDGCNEPFHPTICRLQ